MPWAVYLWPGLPQLPRDGRWTALVVAIGAAALLDVVLLASYVWTDWIAPDMRIMGWALLGFTWSGSAVATAWAQRRVAARQDEPGEDCYQEAQVEYLKGNWFEAERLVGRLLRRDNEDLQARLMLSALLRHTQRFDEAGRQIDLLARLEGARGWAPEIHREAELLAEARQRMMTPANSE